MKIYRGHQDLDYFVSLSEQILRNVALYYFTKNITIIHK